MLFYANKDVAQTLLCALINESSHTEESAVLSHDASILAAAAETVSWLLTAQVCKPESRAWGQSNFLELLENQDIKLDA